MGSATFNVSLADVKGKCLLPLANDALVVVLLKSAGLEADAVLRDHDDLAALLAASNDECDRAGYARKVITSGITIQVDDTNNKVTIAFADQTWTGVATGNDLGKAVIGYDNDTTGGTDSSIVVVTLHDFVVITDGSDIALDVPATGFFEAA